MIAVDKDALFCDLWEVYGIREPEQVPMRKLGMLAAGLGENSRIRMRLSGMRYPLETMLMAQTVDALRYLFWVQTGGKRRNRPKSLVDILAGRVRERPEENVKSFSSGEDFEEARRLLLERIRKTPEEISGPASNSDTEPEETEEEVTA